MAMLCEISAIEAASCSALAATDWTLLDVSPTACDAECASLAESATALSISTKFSSISVLRFARRSICGVMSEANFTIFATFPASSRIGL